MNGALTQKVQEKVAAVQGQLEGLDFVTALLESERPDLRTLRESGDEMVTAAKEIADEWWSSAPDMDPPPFQEQETDMQQEAIEGAGRSPAYLAQLYIDAAKAQKRLECIARSESLNKYTARMPSIKGIARATEKVRLAEEDSEGATSLRDLSRGTIEVEKLHQVRQAVIDFVHAALEKAPLAKVTQLKNKFNNPSPSGYGDIQLHIRLDAGHICEMQFQCRELLVFKEEETDWAELRSSSPDASLMDTIRGFIPALLKLDSIPADACASLKKMQRSWTITSHDTYNVSRWLSSMKDRRAKAFQDLEKLSTQAAFAQIANESADADHNDMFEQLKALSIDELPKKGL